MSVVVTSRPTASTPLHNLPDIDRLAEVHGFTKEHTVEYILSEFTSNQAKADRLLEQLENNPPNRECVQCSTQLCHSTVPLFVICGILLRNPFPPL